MSVSWTPDVERVAGERHDRGVLGGDAELVDVAGDDAVLGLVAGGEPRDTHPPSLPARPDGDRCLPWWLWKPDRDRPWRRLDRAPRAHEARVDAWVAAAPGAAPPRRRAPGRGLPVHLLLPAARGAAALAPGLRRRAARRAGVRRRSTGYVDRDGVATVVPRARRSASARWSSALRTPAGRDRGAAARSSAASGCTSGRWSTGSRPTQVRHAGWPLRLGGAGTDEVVESHRIGCSHFDAFRFFTDAGAAAQHPAARAATTGRRSSSRAACTPGWTSTSTPSGSRPLVPSELVADCFELARDIRVLDMRASPYDLTALGYAPVRSRRPTGKQEYVAAQRAFAERGAPLRQRLVEECDAAAPAAEPPPWPEPRPVAESDRGRGRAGSSRTADSVIMPSKRSQAAARPGPHRAGLRARAAPTPRPEVNEVLHRLPRRLRRAAPLPRRRGLPDPRGRRLLAHRRHRRGLTHQHGRCAGPATACGGLDLRGQGEQQRLLGRAARRASRRPAGRPGVQCSGSETAGHAGDVPRRGPRRERASAPRSRRPGRRRRGSRRPAAAARPGSASAPRRTARARSASARRPAAARRSPGRTPGRSRPGPRSASQRVSGRSRCSRSRRQVDDRERGQHRPAGLEDGDGLAAAAAPSTSTTSWPSDSSSAAGVLPGGHALGVDRRRR